MSLEPTEITGRRAVAQKARHGVRQQLRLLAASALWGRPTWVSPPKPQNGRSSPNQREHPPARWVQRTAGLPKQDCGDGLLQVHTRVYTAHMLHSRCTHTLPSGSGDASAEVCEGWVAGKVGLRLGISQTDTSWEVKGQTQSPVFTLPSPTPRQLLPPDNTVIS